MTKATKQVAVVATLKLLGLAVIEEVTSDYLAFRAKGLKAVRPALAIAAELEADFGYPVAIRF